MLCIQNSDIHRKNCILKYLKSSLLVHNRSPEQARSPNNAYLLDAINEINLILAIQGGSMILNASILLENHLGYDIDRLQRLDLSMNRLRRCSWQLEKEIEDLSMVRVSECKNWIALVFRSRIRIVQSRTIENRERKMGFNLDEGKYTYLEWSPLNYASFEKPSFLTLDDKGGLRVHYVEEKTEQVIREGEIFRCATFSLRGKYIYAINDQQEICKIDLKGLKIVMKRKIKGLDDPVKVFSSHIQQLSHWIFAIGSVNKDEPCLHLVYGGISDEEEELRIKAFEMPLLEPSDSVMFRTLYIKERHLLLFGHTGSNKVRVLQFGLDGSETEIEGLSLGQKTLRGMTFMKEERPGELKNEYENKELELSKGPQILILDSLDEIHHFRFFDPNCSAPTVSLFRRPVTIYWYVGKRDQFKARLSRTRKIRYKSLYHPKVEIIDQKKKRSKSQAKISSEEKPKKDRLFTGESPLSPEDSFPLKEKLEEEKQTTTTTPQTNGLFPSTNNLFSTTNNLFSTKSEDKPTIKNSFVSSKTADNKTIATTNGLFNLFPTKTEDKPKTTNGLFSSPGGCLFGFQKPESSNGPQNSLFKAPLGSANNFNPFGKKPQPTLTEAQSKRAALFLNKLESDVTFKVEDQEFPAHKSILSEKCTFFKNMFSSGMSESYASVIEISDTKAPMFKSFLQYVYIGETILNEELAIGLIGFSKKYMINELKLHCENHLASVLTLENCIKIFETACIHEADVLKKNTLRFFQANIKEIMQRKDLEDLPKETYLCLKRCQWNDKVIFDPVFNQFVYS